MVWTLHCGICVLLFGVVSAEAPQEYRNDAYSSISYSAPYDTAKPAAKSAPYPAATYTNAPAPVASAPAPVSSGTGPSAPAVVSGPGSGPSGLGPSGGGPSGPGPSGPGPFGPGPGPLAAVPFGGPFGFGPGPFLPYAYGGYPYGFKHGILPFFLTKLKVGFKYLENILAPIGTITTLINVLNFLKVKVVPKFVTKLHELQAAHSHDVAAEVITAARRYRRSLSELDDLAQRVLTAIDKNMCLEKLTCQLGKKSSDIVPLDSSWVNKTLGILKKLESPDSLISIFRQSMSNVISDCDVIDCKNKYNENVVVKSNGIDNDLDAPKTLDEDENQEEEQEEEEDDDEGERTQESNGNDGKQKKN